MHLFDLQRREGNGAVSAHPRLCFFVLFSFLFFCSDARELAPCVLILDQLDAIAAQRSFSSGDDSVRGENICEGKKSKKIKKNNTFIRGRLGERGKYVRKNIMRRKIVVQGNPTSTHCAQRGQVPHLSIRLD